jgi:hypothetical protein
MSHQHTVQFWDFETAPLVLQRVIPLPYKGGWIGFIPAGHPNELMATVLGFLIDSGLCFVCCGTGEGYLVVAGPQPHVRQ